MPIKPFISGSWSTIFVWAQLLLLVTLMHCIVPPPIEEETILNKPLNIDQFIVTPRPYELIVPTKDNHTETFSVPEFIDPDIEDTLYLRWFHDYRNSTVIQKDASVQPNNLVVRDEAKTHSIDFCKPNTFILDDPTGTHLIELVATDRPWDSEGDLTNRAIQTGATFTTLTWVVFIEEGVCDPE